MKKNMGNTDRMIRILFALFVAALFFFNVIEGTVAYVLLALGAVSLLTALLNWCGLYALFGINTCKVKQA